MKETQTNPDAGSRRMLAFYEGLQCRGVEFFVDGEVMSLQDVKKNALQEESVYMADYVMDEQGAIIQVRFDKVDNN